MIFYQQENSSGQAHVQIDVYTDYSYVPHLHRDLEFVLLLEGEMTLHLDDTPLLFHAGDSIRIPPLVKHCWFNNSDKPAVLVFAITFPGL